MKFLALIQGGLGPDVWDKDVEIDAVDFLDAAKQATGKAEIYGGTVTGLEQSLITMTSQCGTSRTPKGWFCTRDLNHEGPCAAVPPTRDAESLLKEVEGVLERLADKASRYWDAPPDVEYPITVLLSTCRNAAALLAKIREGK